MGQILKAGFLVFFLSLSSCAVSQAPFGVDFYEGLKQRQSDAAVAVADKITSTAPNEADSVSTVALFEKALESVNRFIAAAAAAELMSLSSAGAEITPQTMTLIRRRAAGSWKTAFEVMEPSGGIDREKALALLLNGAGRLPDEAAAYVLREWRDRDDDGSPSEAENAAIDGRIAVSHFRYREALVFFRIAMGESPELFFRYPDLLADLGRSFQYTSTGREGIDLFLEWEKNLSAGMVNEHLLRFRLLFFAARIARQRGLPDRELFQRALACAPALPADGDEDNQADACIWYILDSSLAGEPDETIRYLETYIPQWSDDAYFSDVMDKLARELILKRRWDYMVSVFMLLRNRSGEPTAKYAWIIARAIEEGLLPPEELNRAGALMAEGIIESADKTAALVKAYMRIAYSASYNAGAAALYYRSLSAAALDEPFLVLPEKKSRTAEDPEIMQFLLGFFENGAAQFAPRHIRAMEDRLSPEEQSFLAASLGESGQYQESLRLVSLYTKRDAYQLERRDLELLYPRPFREQVEQYAAASGIEPALLYGLIRTESAFDPDIVSRSGAVGLTQLMPATAAEAAARILRQGGPDYAGGDDDFAYLRNPAANIHIGAAYLAYLNERMEDPLLALLAYNGGMGRIRRWRAAHLSLPPDLFVETVEYPETRNYGRDVMAAAAMYRTLYYQQLF